MKNNVFNAFKINNKCLVFMYFKIIKEVGGYHERITIVLVKEILCICSYFKK